ncbi:MAG: prepilin-type N-terminal cleavage/methylation domain-containing protein [Pseudomonadales bacterium]
MQWLRGSRQAGFTLIEVVVGIVVMAIALTLLTTVFFTDPGRSVRPMLQIRAAEFGQSLMDEILSKKFDEATPLGGLPACTVGTCTASGSFGSESESRFEYDDVDDYHDYCTAQVIEDAQGNNPPNFAGFQMSVCLIYDGDYDGGSDADINAKLITVKIYLPSDPGLVNPIQFSAYRGNF